MLLFMIRIIEQTLLYLPLVLGSYVSLSIMKIPDLSLESSFVFGAVTGGAVLPYCQHLPLPLVVSIVLLTSIIGGIIIGCIVSSIVHYGKLAPLLASIVTIGLGHGLSLCVLHGNSYYSLNRYINPLAALPFVPHRPEMGMLLLINSILIVVFIYVLRTQVGFALCIYGNNPAFFNYFHQSVTYVYRTGMSIAHAYTAVAGYILAQSNGFIELTMGYGIILVCVTALILGKALLQPALPSITVPLVGTVLYITLQQSLLYAGITSKYFSMIQAITVLAIMLYLHRNAHTSMNTQQLGV